MYRTALANKFGTQAGFERTASVKMDSLNDGFLDEWERKAILQKHICF